MAPALEVQSVNQWTTGEFKPMRILLTHSFNNSLSTV